MDRWKRILNKLLFPGAAVVIVSVPVSAALLCRTFLFDHENEPAAYLSYLISAYATVIVCARVPKLVRSCSARIHRNQYAHRYLTDVPFRMQVSLYLSSGINLLYAVMKLCFGVYYRSVWFGTFGAYYALLTAMRFLLLAHARRNAFGTELVSEWRRYRLCGTFLLPMTAALSGVVVLMIEKNEGFAYAGYLIYVVAMYAFYAAASALVNVVKYRKYQSPVISAAKAISLASALVSILSLETAMLSQFNDGDLLFRRVMISASGAGVCAIILGMALFMIVRATKRLNAPRANQTSQ